MPLRLAQLTLRAWVHADGHKRRTLSRADVANAIAKTDVFDFLLGASAVAQGARWAARLLTRRPPLCGSSGRPDIVPHDGGPKREAAGGAGAAAAEAAEGEPEDEQDDEGR